MAIEYKDVLMLALPFLGSIVGWVTRAALVQAKVSETELDNTAKAIKIWRDLANDLDAKVKLLTAQITRLEGQVDVLLGENDNQKNIISRQTEKLEELEARLLKFN